MVCGRKIFHVFSVYAPQQGRPEEKKSEFLEKLSDNIHDVPQEDLLMVAGDINYHTGSACDGFEDVMGCFSFGVRTNKYNLRVMNSHYQKRQEHLITYKIGGNEIQIDRPPSG